MSAEINFNVAQNHIRQELAKICQLKDSCESPQDWARTVIQVFTDMWDMNEVERYRNYSIQLADLFTKFLFDIQAKTDDLAKHEYNLGLTSVVFFALNLHAKIHGSVNDQKGEKLVSLLRMQLSSVKVGESLQSTSTSVEDVMIDAFNRELKHRRLQGSCHEVIKSLAVDQELDNLAGIVGAQVTKKRRKIQTAFSGQAKRFSLRAVKKEQESTIGFAASSSNRQFTFGEEPKIKVPTTPTPKFPAERQNAESEKRFQPGNSEKNSIFLQSLIKKRLGREEVVVTKMEAEGPRHPVMFTFSEEDSRYPKYEPPEGPMYERLNQKSKLSSARNSIDNPNRRDIASSSYRPRKSLLQRQSGGPQTSKYLLNIINCPDEEYFDAKYKKRCGLPLNSEEEARLENKFGTPYSRKRSASVDSSYCGSASMSICTSREQSPEARRVHASRSQSPPARYYTFTETIPHPHPSRLSLDHWESGILALPTPPSEPL